METGELRFLDLNYPPAFRRFHDHGVVPQIMNRVDGDRRVHALGEEITRFVLSRATVAKRTRQP